MAQNILKSDHLRSFQKIGNVFPTWNKTENGQSNI